MRDLLYESLCPSIFLMDSAQQSSPGSVDHGVLATFEPGTTVLSATSLRTSSWATTGQLHVRRPDGKQECYFVKSAAGEHGRVMMRGEFHAMAELYRWAPDMVPKPHSWGDLASGKASFFIGAFVDMVEGMPDPEQLCAKLARLHRESRSPTGQFGFAVATCQGRTPQAVGWSDDWTAFFTQLLRHVARVDFQGNGEWADLRVLEEQLLARVVPRMLNALVAHGRRIRPCLIHADLWEGNTGTSAVDGRLYLFDSAAFYAHNEMEVADWRCYYNKISDAVYTQTYLQHVPPSEPKEEWEDRNQLYSIYYNIIYSVNHESQGTAVRQLAYSDMYALIDKFAPFPPGEGPPRLDKSSMASLSSERDHTM